MNKKGELQKISSRSRRKSKLSPGVASLTETEDSENQTPVFSLEQKQKTKEGQLD
mgnify:CR=1 FL=1